jgi:hypothetical protein
VEAHGCPGREGVIVGAGGQSVLSPGLLNPNADDLVRRRGQRDGILVAFVWVTEEKRELLAAPTEQVRRDPQ